MKHIVCWVLAGLLMSGCAANKKDSPRPEPMAVISFNELAQRVNTETETIPQLWSRVKIILTWEDEKPPKAVSNHRSRKEMLNGYLIFRRPKQIVLIGKKLNKDIFRLGCSAELDTYWYWNAGLSDQMPAFAVKGKLSHADTEQKRPLPIRPDHLIDMLGLDTINTDPKHAEKTALTVYNTPPVNILTHYRTTDAGTLKPLKEVWYDRRENLPVLVKLFSRDGRVVLWGRLADHEKLPDSNARLARRLRLTWPERRATMDLELSRPRVKKRFNPSVFRCRPPAGVPIQSADEKK